MKTGLIFISVIVFLTFFLWGSNLTTNIIYNPSELILSEFNGYDYIGIDNGMYFSDPGNPALPAKTIYLSIPHTSRVISVDIEEQQWQNIGYYNVIPCQQVISIGEELIWTDENSTVYNSLSYYPNDPLINYGTSSKSGFMIADITYCPFRYNPVTDELQLLTEAILNVNYQSGLSEVVYLSPNQLNIFSEDVKTMVDNPEVVDINSPFLNTEISGLVEYAIITPQELVSSFEPLIEWKNQRGIRANIFSKEWILLNYSGYYDDMECIREFIKDLYANHGLIYVILAGDFDNLGARLVPINFQETNYNSPCDCYFSDLDSNWDGNGNHIYGEWQVDGCDWRSDVYVGRFPINTNDEVNRWINKLIKYEKDPCTNYFERSLMAGTEINGNLNWYGDTICDSIVDNHLPDHWHSVKMYQTESYTPPGFIDSFNTGYNWCYICSHGNITKTYWNDYPDIADILSTACNITNGEKLGILHSSACNPGYFDNHECLAEYVFNSPGGGAIAIIMNAREGLWAPPSIGPSCWIDIKLATFIFDQEKWNIGISHAFAKEFLLSWMNFRENDHFAFIENTLFGDPETQLYTSEPIQLYGEHDTVIYMGEGQFTISLSAEDNPTSGVTCCLYRTGNHDIWFRDTTNTQAVATISYEITSPGDLLVTAYDHNYRCYIDTIEVYPRPYWPTYKYPYLMNWDWFNEELEGSGNYVVKTEDDEYLFTIDQNYAKYAVLNEQGQLLDSGTYLNPTVLKSVNCIYEIPEQGYIYGGRSLQGFSNHGVIRIVNTDYEIIGGEDIGVGEVHRVISTDDGNYLAVGTLEGSIWMGKFTIKEESYIRWIWRSQYKNWGEIEGCFYSAIESSDNCYLTVGHLENGGSCLFKISSTGVLIDSTSYQDGVPGYYTGSFDLVEDIYSAGYLMVGKSYNGYNDYEGYIQKVDTGGNVVWRNEYLEIEELISVYIDYGSSKIIAGGNTEDLYLDEPVGIVLHANYSQPSQYFVIAPFGDIYTPALYTTELINVFQITGDGYITGGTIINVESEQSHPVLTKIYYAGQDNSGGIQNSNLEIPTIASYNFICHNNLESDQTIFNYQLPFSTNVEIDIYNIAGQHVVELFNGNNSTGQYRLIWDHRNNQGQMISSGIYFVIFKTDQYQAVKPINIIR